MPDRFSFIQMEPWALRNLPRKAGRFSINGGARVPLDRVVAGTQCGFWERRNAGELLKDGKSERFGRAHADRPWRGAGPECCGEEDAKTLVDRSDRSLAGGRS